MLAPLRLPVTVALVVAGSLGAATALGAVPRRVFVTSVSGTGDLGSWPRATRRFRTSLMDISHGANRLLRRFGIRVPKGIRRRIARVMEGP